jgi:hypothetical protein
MKKAKFSLLLLAILGLSMSAMYAQSTYVITKSGTNFKASESGTSWSTAPSVSLQQVIEDIGVHNTIVNASGDCTIQFGNSTTIPLDLGTDSISLENSASITWGKISIAGKLTSAFPNLSFGIINVWNDITIDFKADISTTVITTAILNAGNGTVNIIEGKIGAANPVRNGSIGTINMTGGELNGVMAIVNLWTGSVNVSGGKVFGGCAIENERNGKSTISGTALVTSNNGLAATGTIFLANNDLSTDWRLRIAGGTIENTSLTGNAIYNNSSGAVEASGGMVLAKEGKVFVNAGIGKLTGNGGIGFAYGSSIFDVVTGTFVVPDTSNSVLVAWAKPATPPTYDGGSSTDLLNIPALTAVWGKQEGIPGIKVNYKDITKGFIPIDGVTLNIPKHKVIVWNGSGNGMFEEDATVTITANPPLAGQVFDAWVTNPDVTFVDGTTKNSPIAKFTMPKDSVEATATFKAQDAIETPHIASLLICPNPTTGELIIINNEQLTMNNVEIYDVYGRNVSYNHHIITSSYSLINISAFPAGIYFLKFQTEQGVVTKKIIKQ